MSPNFRQKFQYPQSPRIALALEVYHRETNSPTPIPERNQLHQTIVPDELVESLFHEYIDTGEAEHQPLASTTPSPRLPHDSSASSARKRKRDPESDSDSVSDKEPRSDFQPSPSPSTEYFGAWAPHYPAPVAPVPPALYSSTIQIPSDILDGSRKSISDAELAALVAASKLVEGKAAFKAWYREERLRPAKRKRARYHLAKYECAFCDEDFTRSDRMKSHYTTKTIHGFRAPSEYYRCEVGCRFETSNKDDLKRHRKGQRHQNLLLRSLEVRAALSFDSFPFPPSSSA